MSPFFLGVEVQVFVLDKNGDPLMPCHPARARRLLDSRRAVVHRVHPFTIRLKDRVGGEVQPVSLKFDPGSKVTGIAVAREGADGTHALWGADLHHRGESIKKALQKRSAYRRRRRSANLRYRAPRFDNRRRGEGWLPPSLRHRVDNMSSWTRRLMRLCPVSEIVVESVRFDAQKMVDPEISGVEYQQGTLESYEEREYLLEKWGRRCCYCDAKDVPLNVDHVQARARGGSNRVSNKALACVPCNQRKGTRDVRDFLGDDPDRLARILMQLQKPLKDAAAVNATRNKIRFVLSQFGVSFRTGTGGQTKWNRSRLGVPKTHVNDALCVGSVDAVFGWEGLRLLRIDAIGRGEYCRTQTDKFGFVRCSKNGKKSYLVGKKRHGVFQTGSLVRAVTRRGIRVGHVNVRSNGTAYIAPSDPVIKVTLSRCVLLQQADGYRYSFGARVVDDRRDVSPIDPASSSSE